MLKYSFRICGHRNILSTHRRTVEFTKDAELTKEGDCILGVRADFELEQLQRFLNCSRVSITIATGNVFDTIIAIPNKKFSSSHELVIRIGEFDSERTFAVRADKASSNLSRALVASLKSGSTGTVTISEA